MNDMILETLRAARITGHNTASIKAALIGTYPFLTTAEVLRRLLRMEEAGQVRRHNKNIHGGMTYLWYPT